MKHILSFLKTLLAAGLLSLWVSACKVDPPDDQGSTPVFFLNYAANPLPATTLTAGVDNIYLFTGYALDSLERLECRGSFSTTDCPAGDCPGSVTIEFRNLAAATTIIPDSLFHLGEHIFISNDTTISALYYHTVFKADSTIHFYDFLWEISGVYSGDTIAVDFPSNTPHQVILSATGDSLFSTATRTIVPLGGTTYPSVVIDIQQVNQKVQVTADISAVGPVDITWSTGDTTVSFINSVLKPFYGVTVTDALNNTTAASISLNPAQALPLRSVGFTYTTQVVSPPPMGDVAIQWVDATGEIWRSDRQTQPQSSTIVVTQTEPYEQNENGELTWKMEVQFSCVLYNSAGESRPFSGSGVVAAAYPN